MIESLVDRAATRSHPWMEDGLPPVELSIEVFPPKGPEAAARLQANLEQFVAVQPRFLSVTCGAGGSGVDGTLPLVCDIQERFGVPVAAHMTCAWSSRAEIDVLAAEYWRRGVRRIVALRGDPPKGAVGYQPRPDGYAYAARVFRGSTPTGGPFTKDIVYSKGFVLIYNYVRLAVCKGLLKRVPLLFCGKTNLEDMRTLSQLVDEGIVAPPRYVPPQFADLSALAAWMCYSNFLGRLNHQRIEADYANLL